MAVQSFKVESLDFDKYKYGDNLSPFVAQCAPFGVLGPKPGPFSGGQNMTSETAISDPDFGFRFSNFRMGIIPRL